MGWGSRGGLIQRASKSGSKVVRRNEDSRRGKSFPKSGRVVEDGVQVAHRRTEPARDKLFPELADADALIIRSAVQANAELLEHAPRFR